MCGALADVRFGPIADITGGLAYLALMVGNLGVLQVTMARHQNLPTPSGVLHIDAN
jgi:hypothetical protein